MYTKLSIFFLCLISLSVFGQKKHSIMVIAHEGAKGAMPENTIEGMKKALDMGADALQTEVVITQDGKVILSHEPFFNHAITKTPDGKTFKIEDESKHNIFKMTYNQVKKYDVGSKLNADYPGQSKFKVAKPLLGDFVDEIENYIKVERLNKKMLYFVEIKTLPNGAGKYHPNVDEYVDIVMDVLNDKKIANRVILVSLDTEVLKYVRQYYSKMKLGYMIENKTDYNENIELLGFKPEYYIPYYPLVGLSLVESCRKDKVKIAPWVVNASKMIANLVEWGADAVITDYPNLYEVAFPTEEKGQVVKSQHSSSSSESKALRRKIREVKSDIESVDN